MNRMCRAHPAQRRADRGLTLFEMLVVMGIVGILTAIGVPSFRYITASNRIASEVNGLLGDLQFARAEAIKEGQTVTVCVSTDNTNCSTTSTAWNSGWIVFSDVNNDATINTNIVLHKQTAFSGTDTFNANNGIGSISFNREGFASGPAGFAAGTLITLHASPVSNGTTRCLAVTMIGLATTLTYNQTSNGFTCI